MALITLDFETYYSRRYSLTKYTTEEYIRDYRFEVIGVSVKVNDDPVRWFSGTHEQIATFFRQFPWASSGVLAHNAMFDGAILSWVFGIRPKALFDTMCMGRAIHGVETSASLKALAERHGLGVKGDAVLRAMGKHRDEFTPEELAEYGEYCKNDVTLTYKLFQDMVWKYQFPDEELKLIDLTLRMFTEPVLELDLGLLQEHLNTLQQQKTQLLEQGGVTREDLLSNPKFADVLRNLGVEPPTKTSPRTGKTTYAFAKTDEAMRALLEHDYPQVQTVVAARLGVKSTLEETRTQRFLEIASRGLLPGPIRYYAAHTGRWGGADKINLQNLPSRGDNAGVLKRSIVAPPGHLLVESDSSQIEARVLAWLAEEEELVHAFTVGDDVYKQMAGSIYGKDPAEVSGSERFVGKTTILGAGYGMGYVKFLAQLKNFGVDDIDEHEARRIIQVYRSTYSEIAQLWANANHSVRSMVNDAPVQFGRAGVLRVRAADNAIELPNGLSLRYSNLRTQGDCDNRPELVYDTRLGPTRLYGGKVIENVCQALARCIIGWQMQQIAKKYRVVLTVHDSVVCCVPEDEIAQAKDYVERCMRLVPLWATGLPVNCESKTGKSYGDCK